MPNTPTSRAWCHFQHPCHSIAVVVFHSTGNLSSTTAAGDGPSSLEGGGVKPRTRWRFSAGTRVNRQQLAVQNEQTEVHCGQLDCGREAGRNQQQQAHWPLRGDMQHTSTRIEFWPLALQWGHSSYRHNMLPVVGIFFPEKKTWCVMWRQPEDSDHLKVGMFSFQMSFHDAHRMSELINIYSWPQFDLQRFWPGLLWFNDNLEVGM